MFTFATIFSLVFKYTFFATQEEGGVLLKRPKTPLSCNEARFPALTCLTCAPVKMIRMGIANKESRATLREKQMKMMSKTPENRYLKMSYRF
jgi:hypothetical protein